MKNYELACRECDAAIHVGIQGAKSTPVLYDHKSDVAKLQVFLADHEGHGLVFQCGNGARAAKAANPQESNADDFNRLKARLNL